MNEKKSKQTIDSYIESWQRRIKRIEEQQSIDEKNANDILQDFEKTRLILEIKSHERDFEDASDRLENLKSELKTALSLAISPKTEISNKKKFLGITLSEKTTITPRPSKVLTEDKKALGFNLHAIGASYGEAKKRKVQFEPKKNKRGRKRTYT